MQLLDYLEATSPSGESTRDGTALWRVSSHRVRFEPIEVDSLRHASNPSRSTPIPYLPRFKTTLGTVPVLGLGLTPWPCASHRTGLLSGTEWVKPGTRASRTQSEQKGASSYAKLLHRVCRFLRLDWQRGTIRLIHRGRELGSPRRSGAQRHPVESVPAARSGRL